MSLLVSDSDLITITIYYTTTKNKYGCKFIKVLEEEKAKEMLLLPEAENVKALTTKWKPQTWQAQNELFANSMTYNQSNGNRDVDWTRFRHQQLVQCLVDWDLIDDTGRPYPVTEDNINQLHASIANALSNKYSEAISLEEDEVKKSPANS